MPTAALVLSVPPSIIPLIILTLGNLIDHIPVIRITIEYTHKVTRKAPNILPLNLTQLLDGRQSLIFRHHGQFVLDPIINLGLGAVSARDQSI